MSNGARALMWSLAIGGFGVVFFLAFTPDEKKMREKLGYRKGEAPSMIRYNNEQIMAVIRQRAGIKESDSTKKDN